MCKISSPVMFFVREEEKAINRLNWVDNRSWRLRNEFVNRFRSQWALFCIFDRFDTKFRESFKYTWGRRREEKRKNLKSKLFEIHLGAAVVVLMKSEITIPSVPIFCNLIRLVNYFLPRKHFFEITWYRWSYLAEIVSIY